MTPWETDTTSADPGTTSADRGRRGYFGAGFA